MVAAGQATSTLGGLRGHAARGEGCWSSLPSRAGGECVCLLACLLRLASPLAEWRTLARTSRPGPAGAGEPARRDDRPQPATHRAGQARRIRSVLRAGPRAAAGTRARAQDRAQGPAQTRSCSRRAATRLGCVCIGRAGSAAITPADAVAELASRLGPGDALVLFPEGSDWTPTRHRLAVRRLHGEGLRAQALAAARMPNVLPPQRSQLDDEGPGEHFQRSCYQRVRARPTRRCSGSSNGILRQLEPGTLPGHGRPSPA
jgi:hypothetical protein